MSKTHRCAMCAQEIEHEEKELCPSCGRCEEHCAADNHDHMQRVEV